MISPVALRHKIHQNPELALQEFETTNLLIENIKSGAEYYNTSITIHRPIKTGLVVEYNYNKRAPYTLLRADIDALPTIELTEWKFQSKNQNMHACGHDVHTAALYGFLLYILENQPTKNILFLFQPAEEAVGGAEMILNSGILNQYTIAQSYALHVNDDYEKGTIATNDATLFASSYELDIEFYGNSAHVAFPQNGNNALSAFRMFMDDMEKIPQNYIRPIIFGIGKVQSGKVRNIVPDYAKLEGTIRSFELTKIKSYITQLETILQSIKSATGVSYKMIHGIHHKEVTNDATLFKQARKKLSSHFNFEKCEIKMTGEDYGYFAERYPSLMMWLGTREKKFYGLHNPRFLPEDSIIDDGITVYKRLIT